MNLVLTNPLGFWALLGIPAVILIHFLQRQARVVPISTLFLVAQTQRESVSGRRFDRFTNSIPLWLQLLIVLLLTWLLVAPRYVRPASTQQVAVVLDSSASLSVYKDRLTEALRERLPTLQGSASRLQLYLFESEADKPVLYSGDDLEQALEALTSWQPTAGAVDPGNALRLARSRINREGILLYATDTPTGELPFNAGLLAVGEPRENVGFTGVTFEPDGEGVKWKALVRNYSDQEQRRTWQAVFEDGSKSEPAEMTLPPNAMTTLSSTFPADSKRLQIVLSADDFTFDDVLPLVLPAPKVLQVHTAMSPKFEDFAERFLATFPNLEPVENASQADLSLVSYDPLLPVLPETDSLVVVDETTQSRKYLRGGIVAEKHELTEGLNWQSLLARESIQIELSQSDDVLLWQGSRALIALRTRVLFQEDPSAEPPASPRRARQLIFNFDPTLSNAFRLTATVVLLHRFCEDLRDRKVATETRNTETGQLLELSTRTGANAQPLMVTRFDDGDGTGSSTTVPLTLARYLRAPDRPGFFRVTQGEEVLLESACHFADTREADLRSCASEDSIASSGGEAVERNTSEDHFWRLWVLLVLAALLLAWFFTRDRPRDEEPSAQPATS